LGHGVGQHLPIREGMLLQVERFVAAAAAHVVCPCHRRGDYPTDRVAQTVTSAALASSRTPSGVLSCRPQDTFFSSAITAPSPSIQARLPTPTANISSMSSQQQPTQNSPWCTPSANA